uniref:Uncharacterized protein n=1 Tax=Rhizophora mucronata TaxID=61149 RepID=A0A2P2QS68_RHIMU
MQVKNLALSSPQYPLSPKTMDKDKHKETTNIKTSTTFVENSPKKLQNSQKN